MRTMYDGVTAGNLPINATMVAGYVSGRYAWTNADWQRFPNSVHVRIATQATVNDGTVLDVESGDATPVDSVDWVIRRRTAGIHPTVYCSLSSWADVSAAFRARKVAEPEYWIAHYDGLADIPYGAVAKQYQNTPGYDVSAVADYWPGIDDGGTMATTNDDWNQFLHYNYIPSSIPAPPAGYISVAEALTSAHNATAEIAALKFEVDALSSAPPVMIDYAALAAALIAAVAAKA